MIWRRLLVHSDVTLDDLHHIFQAAMGWHDTHRYEFIVGERVFGLPDEDDSMREQQPGHSRSKKLRLVARETDLFRYIYDFGDHWEHRVVVERFNEAEPHYPGWVLDGARACPPEDCGGISGYRAALMALGKQGSISAQEFLDWAGADFDPAIFDRFAANAALSRMAWNRWINPPAKRR